MFQWKYMIYLVTRFKRLIMDLLIVIIITEQINLKNFPVGIYYLVLRTNGGSMSGKFGIISR